MHAGLPCGAWVESGDTLELNGPRAHIVLRAAPEHLAALRRSLLSHCEAHPAKAPPLDVGPVQIDAILKPDPAAPQGVVEMRLHMRAERLRMTLE